MYDAAGRRIAYIYEGHSNPEEWPNKRLVYDGIHLIEERHLNSGQLIAKYHYENAMSNCPLYVERDTDNNGTLDQKLIVITDDRGTVVGLADESGNVVERVFYNSTGLIKGFDVEGNPCKNKYGKETYRCSIPFGYTGMMHDPFTGKYHTLYRDMDAVTCRWLSEDPAGYQDGLNLYNAYFDVNGRDPLGLESIPEKAIEYVEHNGKTYYRYDKFGRWIPNDSRSFIHNALNNRLNKLTSFPNLGGNINAPILEEFRIAKSNARMVQFNSFYNSQIIKSEKLLNRSINISNMELSRLDKLSGTMQGLFGIYTLNKTVQQNFDILYSSAYSRKQKAFAAYDIGMPTATVLVNTAQFLGPQVARDFAKKANPYITVTSTLVDVSRCAITGYELHEAEGELEESNKKHMSQLREATIPQLVNIGTIEAYNTLKEKVKVRLRTEFWKVYKAQKHNYLGIYGEMQDRDRYHRKIEGFLEWKVDQEGNYRFSPEWKAKLPISCLK